MLTPAETALAAAVDLLAAAFDRADRELAKLGGVALPDAASSMPPVRN